MTPGILLTVAGVWLLSQVLAGNALGRLAITGEPTKPGTSSSGPAKPKTEAPGPFTGVPVPPKFVA